MDEPLSNLDAKLRVQTRAELIKLHRRLGITTIYVTHDQVEAMTMGDRIAVMKDGVIQQVDTPLGLYNHPATMFVSGFIGTPSMNFLNAKISNGSEGYVIDGGCFRVKAPQEKAELLKDYVGKEVIFGIRPEDIFDKNLANIVPSTPDNQAKAIVDVIEPMGPIVTMYLRCGEHSLVATIDAETKAKEGQEIELVFDMAKTHVFDKATESAVY
jgi:multiple sugar transport system ATP-binding protein